MVHGHWNGDAFDDVATFNVGTGQILAFVGDGNGGFSESAALSANTDLPNLTDADVNGDGKADLLWSAASGSGVAIALGNGDGTFQAPATTVIPGVGPFLLQAGAFTYGDAVPDLAILGLDGSDHVVLALAPGNGNGTFQSASTYDLGPFYPNDGPTSLAAGDVDGDGRVDFAVPFEDGTIRLVLGANTADLIGGGLASISEGSHPRSVVLADLDADGDLDLATANSGLVLGENGLEEVDLLGRISIFFNDGSGVFGADHPEVVGSFPTSLIASDLNGDGYADLSVTHLTVFGVSPPVKTGLEVLISDAHGGFSAPEETVTGYAPFAHAVLDVNGDGLNDAVLADVATSSLSVLQNYLTVAASTRVQPKVMFAKWRAAPANDKPPVRVAASDPAMAALLLAQAGGGGPSASALPAGYAAYWYHNDHLGTPQVMTDQAGLVVWKGNYKPFGEVTTPVETVVNNFRLPGQYEDQEASTYRNWHRSYAAVTGRYVESDPLSASALAPVALMMPETAPYPYGRNSPNRWIDRHGLQSGYPCNYQSLLQERYDRVTEILGGLQAGTLPTSEGVGVCRTGCENAQPSISCEVGTPECYLPCMMVHENVHAQQCRQGLYVDLVTCLVSSDQ